MIVDCITTKLTWPRILHDSEKSSFSDVSRFRGVLGFQSMGDCRAGRNLSARGKFPAVVNLNTASDHSDPQIQEKFSSSDPFALFLMLPIRF
ncbi:hypothetical protein A6X21_15365 [Planctopirus hydrillae]|uniref:Uncharacterized protein n=1 Tax=Planctopirus hydrillae TaxID=1841610 RepID=A0A1C3ETW0_9PLAN|nr:hypothetical protein A6X21_15365 [Planctopirus hydrillae]